MKEKSPGKLGSMSKFSGRSSGRSSNNREEVNLATLKFQSIPEKTDLLEQQLDDCLEQLNKENIYEFKDRVKRSIRGNTALNYNRSEKKAKTPSRGKKWEMDEEVNLPE